MTSDQLAAWLSHLPELHIVVIGDFFLDKYLLIDPQKDEPSLETGLTAYQVTGRRLYPGAAGTVTNNLRGLGVGRVTALGFCGDDGEGYDLRQALVATGVSVDELVVTKERVTPTYTKPMRLAVDGEQEINRLDLKNWTPTPVWLENELISKLHRLADTADAVIALDQVTEEGFGVITPRMRAVLAAVARTHPNLPVYVDSRAYTDRFADVIIKCNHREAMRTTCGADVHADEHDLERIIYSARRLAEKTSRPVFVTRGAQGQVVVAPNDGTETERTVYQVPGIPVTGPIDVVGAGDATTAGIVCALCCGATPQQAALVGNLVASITIQQLGVTGTATPQQVLERFNATLPTAG